LFYEYRKDVWGYLFFLGLYQLLQFVYHRLTGDATLMSGDDELAPDLTAPNRTVERMTNTGAGQSSSEPVTKVEQQGNVSAATIPTAARSHTPQHFLVKKLDREFLVAISDIEWLEACGNYVNLHSKGRIYPLRATLSQTMLQLEIQGFSRIHRSFAVNHRHIDNISYQPSGDGELVLKNGQQLALSRRFKDQFRTRFQAGG
jgi:DNA-binding LytR/AlgR family response regulator